MKAAFKSHVEKKVETISCEINIYLLHCLLMRGIKVKQECIYTYKEIYSWVKVIRYIVWLGQPHPSDNVSMNSLIETLSFSLSIGLSVYIIDISILLSGCFWWEVWWWYMWVGYALTCLDLVCRWADIPGIYLRYSWYTCDSLIYFQYTVDPYLRPFIFENFVNLKR
jgi:hypothetical protein